MDYADIGLNTKLQAINGLAARERNFVSGYDFDSVYERSVVTEYKIQNNAVTTTKIENAAITTAKIVDAAITNAKIVTLAANKLTAGTLTVAVDVGTASGGAFVRVDGANNRIIVNDGTTNRIVIGNV